MDGDSESDRHEGAGAELFVEEHVVEEHVGDDEGGAGLELDDFQSKEIRQIFLTTLPEYLEPVAEMLEQLLQGAREVLKPLDTTLGSVSMAASRVGIDDVADVLDRMRVSAAEAAAHAVPIPDSFRTTLFDGLNELRRFASGGAADAEPRRPGSHRTVVAALRELGGFDASVLERLSSAGLVTVDQLLMAEASEIVAVSGLDPGVVRELCARMRTLDAPKPALPEVAVDVTPADASPTWVAYESTPPQVEAPAEATASVESILEPNEPVSARDRETERQRLVDHLRRQVELEISVDETRARVVRLRGDVARLRDELVAEEQRRSELRARVQRIRDELAQRLLLLSTTRATRMRNERDASERRRALEVAEAGRDELLRTREIVASEHARTSAEMAELLTRVRQLLRSAARPEQQPSDRIRGLGEPSRRGLG